MIFFLFVFPAAVLQVRSPVGHSNWGLASFLLGYCLFFVVVYLVFNHNPLFHEVIYGILVVAMVILDLRLTHKQYSRANMIMLVTGVLM